MIFIFLFFLSLNSQRAVESFLLLFFPARKDLSLEFCVDS